MADYSSILPISLSANFGASYIPNYCAILPVGDTNNTTMTLTIVFWVSVRDLGELNPLMPDDVPPDVHRLSSMRLADVGYPMSL